MDNYTKLMLIHWIEKNLENCADPYIHGKELKGNLKGQWRYRVGDYRILCEKYEGKLIIQVIEIGYQRKIYK